ncbi:hypothetical protein Tsubulata_050299 [Turnera subulata]|uniref:Thioredoxin domain-containing protein n=1 Tax=Turnera subulata TaxID=218843 RepID=A0A9Q0JSN5_9ROSI|nr:hypothetical protein Tsubulata_050299 [Turnera subulata]
MALSHFTIPSSPYFACSSSSSSSSSASTTSSYKYNYKQQLVVVPSSKKPRSWGWVVRVRSSLDTTGPTATVGQVTEVTKDTFWPIVNSAGDKTVVLDMYTQWCGPCKVIAPKFQELSAKYDDVVFLKLDCNEENKVSEYA